jgi:hypothetical protein
VFAEAQGRCSSALSKVGVELHLSAQGDTFSDPFSLASLGIADHLRNGEDLLGACGLHKEHAIVIAQDQVLPIHRPLSYRGGLQRTFRTGIDALRAGWDRSQAEHWQPDRSYVTRVAMQTPDHHSHQPGGLRLQSHEIADARFIESAAIVDHQHVARSGRSERLQEDIDAADVASGTHTPGEAAPDATACRRAGAQRTGT